MKDVLVLNTVVAENIEATNARFGNVEADTAKIHDLEADEIHAGITYTNELIAEDVTTEKLTAASGYIEDLEAGNVTAQNVVADHGTIGSLDVNYAKVNAANIDSAAIRNAWVDKIMVQTGLLAYSSQIYTLDAIEVNAANITAGTLDVNRLIVTVGEGSSAQKYLVNIDPSTGTPSYEKLDGNIVEPRTITADKIVAGAITTNEITANNLQGTSGWINLHEGKFFYGNGADFATATNAISWNGSKLQIKADEFLLSTGQTIQDSIESVENWFYSVPPTTSNPPASSWTTTNLKEQHLRDIYFDTTSGKSYRWAKEGSTYKWVEIEDVELSALAKDLHDNYPPYSEFTVAPDKIAIEVGKKVGTNEVIAKINASTEGVQIQAEKVDIAGAAVFNNYSTTTQMNTAIGNAVDGIEIGGRNLLRRSDYSVYGASEYTYGSDATFSADRVTIPYGKQIWQAPYAPQRISTVIPQGTTVVCSVEVYKQTITDGSHRIYVSMLRSDDTVNWSNVHTLEANTTGKQVWTYEVIEDTYGFVLYFDTRNSTSGEMILGRVKVELGNKATDWTPAPEDIQDEIDAKKSIHTLTSTSSGASYSDILSWTEEGTTQGWGVTSVSGVKVGDTARVAIKASDMGTNGTIVYVVGTVTQVTPSTSRIIMHMHGLDTTVIDGGHILTGTIDANKVGVSNLTVGAFTSAAQNSVLNSNVKVGGRNLCKNTGFNDLSMWYGSPSVSGGKLTITTATEVGISNDYKTNVTIPTGTEYTVSCYFYENTISDGNRRIYFRDQPAWDYWTVPANFTGLFSRTATATVDITRLAIEYDTRNKTGGKWVVGPVKIEIGNVATDWAPAPEDVGEAKYLTSSYSVTYPNLVRWVKDYTVDTYTVTSTAGIKVNDIVYIQVACTTTGTNMFVQGRVTEIPSATSVKIMLMALIDKPSYASTIATTYITEIDSAGIFISPADQSPTTSATGNSVKINASGMEVYKGGASVAFYGDTARVGKSGGSRVEISTAGMDIYGKNDYGTWHCGTIGIGSTNTGSGTDYNPYYTFGYRSGAIGAFSATVGSTPQATGYSCFAQGQAKAGGMNAAAVNAATASGDYSFACGVSTASADNSFASGSNCAASHTNSAAFGNFTKTSANDQFVVGKSNANDSNALFIVGKGSSSNAFTVSNTGVVAVGNAASTVVESEHTILNNASVSAGGYNASTLAITKSGYYPIAISGWNSSTRFLCLTRCRLTSRANGSATIDYMIYNPSGSARTGTVTVDVIWMKLA